MRNILTSKLAAVIEGALEAAGASGIDVGALIEVPPTKELGDYAFPCFQLAKRLRKAPNLIASDIAAWVDERIAKEPWLAKVETVGGYVNFFLDPGEAGRTVVQAILSPKEAWGRPGEGKTVVIDYSSPNIAKPFHIGHMRSTIIGHSLARIFELLGYRVVRLNYLGDWGTQFGKLIVAFRRWGEGLDLDTATIPDLLRLYVKFHEEAENDPSLEDEARAAFRALEEGADEERRLWRAFRELSLKEFEQTYKRLGVGFDEYRGESAYNDKMEEAVARLAELGLLEESEGALVVHLGDLPPCLIKKKDGATLYATRDIAAALDRFETYGFDHLLYVVGAPQQLHFKQVFAVLEKMGCEWVDRLEHIAFGHIRFGDEQMSTRKGNVLFLNDLLDEAARRARAIIDERNPGLENKDRVAEQVGIGAVVFNDLAHNRIKDIVFDWDAALNFEGDTGPYVQYTHARTASLLKKAGWERADVDGAVGPDDLVEPEAYELVKRLAAFPEAIAKAAEQREPSEVARQLIAICQGFNSFYHVHRILGSEKEKARAALAWAVKESVALGLYLLGIEAPEEM